MANATDKQMNYARDLLKTSRGIDGSEILAILNSGECTKEQASEIIGLLKSSQTRKPRTEPVKKAAPKSNLASRKQLQYAKKLVMQDSGSEAQMFLATLNSAGCTAADASYIINHYK